MDRRSRTLEFQKFQQALRDHKKIADEAAFHLRSMDEITLNSHEMIARCRETMRKVDQLLKRGWGR